jgi:ADP-ribose pyrophosphatase YjhB (NUDIX family)
MPEAENKPRIIHKSALAYFKGKKIMQVRDDKNERVFILPGGQIEEGEPDVKCLVRELQEELSVELKPDSTKFLKAFIGPAHGKENTLLNVRLYTGEFVGEPKPSQEIVEIDYFDTASDQSRVSEIGRTQIFPWLKEHDYIN